MPDKNELGPINVRYLTGTNLLNAFANSLRHKFPTKLPPELEERRKSMFFAQWAVLHQRISEFTVREIKEPKTEENISTDGIRTVTKLSDTPDSTANKGNSGHIPQKHNWYKDTNKHKTPIELPPELSGHRNHVICAQEKVLGNLLSDQPTEGKPLSLAGYEEVTIAEEIVSDAARKAAFKDYEG